MFVPEKFKADISYSTQVFNIITNITIEDIIIGTPLYISTHSHYFAGASWAPLLKSVPNMVESIDWAEHKFQISNASINISNTPFEGKVFSDYIKQTSFVGAVVKIYLQSPSGELLADCLNVFSGVVPPTDNSA